MKTIASRRTLSRTIAALLFGGAIVSAPAVQAQTWSGATSGAWLTGTNWTGGVAAGSDTVTTDTDIALFDNGTQPTVGINMNTTLGVYYLGAIDRTTNNTARIINNSAGSTPGVLTLNGTTVNGVANTILRNNTTGLLTITNGASTATLGLNLTNAAGNNIQVTNTGGITINSNITGVGGIIRNQGTNTGVLTLAGNNSYTGVTTISTGIVAISNSNALGSTAGVSDNTTIAANGAASGARLQLSNNITSPENITITGATESSGFNGAIRNQSGNNTLSGNIVLSSLTNGVRLDTAGGNLIFSGNISQTGSSQGFSLAPASGSTITVNNPIANNGGVFQTLSSGATGTAGTVILKGVNATDGTGIGATNVAQNSTLQLGVTNALNTTANLSIAAFGGTDQGTFNLNGFDQTVNALNSSASGANRIVRNNSATTASILTVGNGGGTGSFNGTIVNGSTATLALVKTGAGNQTLSGINTYTGGTQIDNGTLTLGHATDTLANTGAVNVNGGTLALGTNTDTVGAVTLTSGSITGSGTASQGVLTGTGSAFDVRSGSVSAKLAGTVGLTKSTVGTVTLSGANTYTGTTTVSAGTLVVTGSLANNNFDKVSIAAPDDSLTGNPILTRATPGSYAGIGSTVVGGLGGTAEILNGTNAGGTDTSLSMQWRLRTASESSSPTNPPLPNGVPLMSEVLSLTGMGNGGAPVNGYVQTDPFVLQMSYDPTLTTNESDNRLVTFDTTSGLWVNAIEGNFTGSYMSFQRAYDAGIDGLMVGRFGVDTVNNVVWAVLDHNSEFAVIPEPSTLVLGGLALLGFAGVGLRRRRMAK